MNENKTTLEKIKQKIATGLTLLVLGTATIGPCLPTKDRNELQSNLVLDQVFTNHRGYTVTYVDTFGAVHQKDFKTHLTIVYKDLQPDEKPYVQIVKCARQNVIGCTLTNLEKAVIHMPKNQGLTPGTETYGNRNQYQYMMHEIR